jgi:hypothetical protein
MNKEEFLTFCMSGCGNNMHIECALKWINHKISQEQKLTCPLCRSEWSRKFYEYIEKQARENRRKALLQKQKKIREENKKKEIQEIDIKLPEIIPNIEIEGNGMTINPVMMHNAKEERKRSVNANDLYQRKPPKDFRVRRPYKAKKTLFKGHSNANPLESLLVSGFQLGGSHVMRVEELAPRTREVAKRLPVGGQEGLELTGYKIKYRRLPANASRE